MIHVYHKRLFPRWGSQRFCSLAALPGMHPSSEADRNRFIDYAAAGGKLKFSLKNK